MSGSKSGDGDEEVPKKVQLINAWLAVGPEGKTTDVGEVTAASRGYASNVRRALEGEEDEDGTEIDMEELREAYRPDLVERYRDELDDDAIDGRWPFLDELETRAEAAEGEPTAEPQERPEAERESGTERATATERPATGEQPRPGATPEAGPEAQSAQRPQPGPGPQPDPNSGPGPETGTGTAGPPAAERMSPGGPPRQPQPQQGGGQPGPAPGPGTAHGYAQDRPAGQQPPPQQSSPGAPGAGTPGSGQQAPPQQPPQSQPTGPATQQPPQSRPTGPATQQPPAGRQAGPPAGQPGPHRRIRELDSYLVSQQQQAQAEINAYPPSSPAHAVAVSKYNLVVTVRDALASIAAPL